MGEWVDVRRLEPSIGDLIQFEGLVGFIEHWAVYIGGEQVIHVAVNGSSGGSSLSIFLGSTVQARIIQESLIDAADGSRCRVSNLENCLESRGLKAKDPNETVRAAKAMLGQDYNYHALNRNCEHFVTECRFGKGFSGQTAATIKTANNLGALGRLMVSATLDENGLPLNPLDHV